MSLILGIHNGHHASCAIVQDGVLISAIEQERITSIKGDGSNYLSNNLPIKKCLQKAGVSIDQIDLIVSSFQAIGPGGVGLIQPIFEEGFDLFDPFDKRHLVISHHYAHALSAYGTSGFTDTGILVSDLAGSTTIDGNDFQLSFSDFYKKWANKNYEKQTKTECLSIYKASERNFELVYREFCVPHCSPEIFICSPASLYDNISRFVFNKDDAHGELMALASVSSTRKKKNAGILPIDIFGIDDNGKIHFKNNWQHKIITQKHILDYALLASVVQEAFEAIILQYVKRTKQLTNLDSLTVAGGVFLNIKTNYEIENSKLFSRYHVPSSPHDAGIAIGCAYHGWRIISNEKDIRTVVITRKASDRIGSIYNNDRIEKVLREYSYLCLTKRRTTPAKIANLIQEGAIIARFSGAAEFGPRALGGRSLLANPLNARSKEILNLIKGRQDWRPVAPIVIAEEVNNYFIGSKDSPYMNQLHIIKSRHYLQLKALSHPDKSARVQTLTKEDDKFLYDILVELKAKIGYPIIINTSFNSKGQPIVETPESAIDFFFYNSKVDYLLFNDILVKRRKRNLKWQETKLASDCIVYTINLNSNPRFVIIRNEKTMEVSSDTIEIIKKLPITSLNIGYLNKRILSELHEAMFLQFLIKCS